MINKDEREKSKFLRTNGPKALDGVPFIQEYKMPLVVLDKYKHLEDWEWEFRLTIVLIVEGNLTLKINDSIKQYPSPSLLYLNRHEIITVMDEVECDYWVIPFHPTIINPALKFKDMESDYPLPLSGALDYYYIAPFFKDLNKRHIELNYIQSKYLFSLIQKMDHILKTQRTPKWHSEARSILSQLLFKMEKDFTEDVGKTGDQLDLVDEICAYIQDLFHQQITLDDLCTRFNINRTTLNQIFKDAIGKTAIEYLLDLRLKSAQKMLAKTKLNVSEICERIGFADPSYFSRTFRTKVGTSPSQYREENSLLRTDS